MGSLIDQHYPGQPGDPSPQTDLPPLMEDGLEDIRKDRAGLRDLVAYIHGARGIDLSGYIESTLARRVAMRVNARGAGSFMGYAKILEKDPEEYKRLLDHLTITVTRFFRNKAALEALKRAVVSIQNVHPGRSVRIWCAGCATGQEPYSIAILLKGRLDADAGEKITILATDIDLEALEFARKGLFSKEQVQNVPKPWLESCFDKGTAGYQIKGHLGEQIDFQYHNLLADPSPGDVDMVVCRNVLIYFRIPIQMRVVRQFYRALNPGGFLLLGRYEMLVREMRHGFKPADFEARLYEKRTN